MSKCDLCGNHLHVYYGEYCPSCFDPTVPETLEYYNLIKVLKHLDTKRPGLYDRVWNYLCGYGYIENDCYKEIWFEFLEDEDKDLKEDFELLHKIFDYVDSVVFQISW
jgi:hypothetical protein